MSQLKDYLSEQQKDTILGLIGELTWEYEHEFDWFEKARIADKIKACDTILDIPPSIEDHQDKWIARIMKQMDNKL